MKENFSDAFDESFPFLQYIVSNPFASLINKNHSVEVHRLFVKFISDSFFLLNFSFKFFF